MAAASARAAERAKYCADNDDDDDDDDDDEHATITTTACLCPMPDARQRQRQRQRGCRRSACRSRLEAWPHHRHGPSRELEQRATGVGHLFAAARGERGHTWEATWDDMVAEGLGESWRR